MTRWGLPIAAAVAVASVAAVLGCAKQSAPDPQVQAQAFVQALAASDFQGAAGQFNDKLKADYPVERLQSTWGMLVMMAGPFQYAQPAGVEEVTEGGETFDAVRMNCQFEKGALELRMVYDRKGKMTGLRVISAQVPGAAPPAQ